VHGCASLRGAGLPDFDGQAPPASTEAAQCGLPACPPQAALFAAPGSRRIARAATGRNRVETGTAREEFATRLATFEQQ
jgi:hypothetical protein